MRSPRRGWWAFVATFGALLLLPLGAFVWLGRGGAVPLVTTAPASSRPSLPRGEPLDDGGARLVVGVVLDEEDEGVAAAEIAVVEQPTLRASSNAEGDFSLAAVPLGAVTLRIRAEGFAERLVGVGAGAPGERTRTEVRLERLGNLGGWVVDPEGDPVADAVVRCRDRPDERALVGSSDEDGRFALPSSALGCAAVAHHRDFAESAEVILAASDDNRLTLEEAAKIAGVVVDERGAPIAAFTVAVESYRPAAGEHRAAGRGPSRRVEDPQGSFELGGLAAGSYVLTVSGEGRPPAQSERLEVASGERLRGVRVVLARGGILLGSVVDAQSRQPIARARVALDSATMTRVESLPSTVTAVDGLYQLEGVPAGPFSVRISADGYVSQVIAGITTAPGAAVVRDVELTPASQDDRRTEYTGIGAMLAPGEHGIVVGQVIAGGPAEAAGLLPQDLLVRIDGRSATDLTIPQAVQLLRGPPGTRVAVGVKQPSGEERHLVITRERFVR